MQLNGRSLPFQMFDKIQTVQPGTIVGNKRLWAVLAMVKARQAEYAPKRQRGHVARQRPPNAATLNNVAVTVLKSEHVSTGKVSSQYHDRMRH